MHRNRFPGHSLCDIVDIAFLVAFVMVVVDHAELIVIAVVADVLVVAAGTADYPSIQDNHAACQCQRLMVSFYLFSR
jgi:hypothetical protein